MIDVYEEELNDEVAKDIENGILLKMYLDDLTRKFGFSQRAKQIMYEKLGLGMIEILLCRKEDTREPRYIA